MAVNRKPLSQLLSEVQMGEDITNRAISGQGFDPQGGWGVAAAQIATAGIGAWAQNRARKEIAEQEVAGQKQFADFLTNKGYTPESAAAAAAITTPEARSASIQDFIKQELKGVEPQTGLAKLGADYKAGLIDKTTYNAAIKKETSFAPDSSASGGATGAIIANLRRENPNLSYAQALMQAQGLARQGLEIDPSGKVKPAPGYTESKTNVAAAESSGRKTGELETEKKFNQPKVQASLDTSFAKSDNVLKLINESTPKVDALTAGFGGSVLSKIPGSDARDLQKQIKTIIANLGFDELQEMRNNSPTGGALGSIVVKEIELLQSVKSNLEQDQSPAQLRANLQSAKNQIIASKNRVKLAYDRQYNGNSAMFGSQDLKSKYGLK